MALISNQWPTALLLCQHLCVNSIRAHELMCIWLCLSIRQPHPLPPRGLLAQGYSAGLWNLRFLKEVLLVKTEAKKVFSTSAICCIIVSSDSAMCPRFPCHLLLSPTYLQKPFLLSLTFISRFNSNWASAFLASILDDWTMSLYSSQITQHWFYPPCTSFVCLSLVGCLCLGLTISTDNLIEGLRQYERELSCHNRKSCQLRKLYSICIGTTSC